MSRFSRESAYMMTGRTIGLLAGLLSAFSVWRWAEAQFGIAGLLVGWLPAALVGLTTALAIMYLWAPLLVCVVIVVIQATSPGQASLDPQRIRLSDGSAAALAHP